MKADSISKPPEASESERVGDYPWHEFGFLPRKSLESPSVIVTPCAEPDHAPMPLAYFVNGYQRHHEKLSGLAGDWMDNRLHACEPNATLSHEEGEKKQL